MKDPAVIAAYFGSGDTASMDLLDAALARAFPGSPVYRAFLRSGFRPSVPEVLASLGRDTPVYVHPMLLNCGMSYRRLLDLCGAPNITVGQPLLSHREAVARAVCGWYPRNTLLMAHGSGGDLTGFAEVLPAGYWLAAMNGQPSLTELLPRLAGTRLYLAPFLLTAGYHVSKDLAAWREHLTTRGCTVEVLPRPLAQCPAIQTIITAHGAMGMGGRKPCD